jgi:hypothetical protein
LSDTNIRTLERRYIQTGTTEDKAAYLRVWTRSGECGRCKGDPEYQRVFQQSTLADLATPPDPCPACLGLSRRERLELAAYCGDEAARETTGWDPARCIPPPAVRSGRWAGHRGPFVGEGVMTSCLLHGDGWSLDSWLAGLAARWPQGVMVRAAVAAGRVALEVWEPRSCRVCRGRGGAPGGHGHYVNEGPRRALEAAEAWLACPCEEHEPYHEAVDFGDYDDATSTWSTPQWATGACKATWSTNAGNAGILGIESAARLTSEAEVRKAICDALIAWSIDGH